MKHIPNSVTLLNLAAGFLSVLMAFEGRLHFAAILILISALLDFLDGTLAKLLDAVSRLGKQLDSLADIISFGMAPAILAYKLMEYSLRHTGSFSSLAESSLGIRLLMLSPLLLVLCAAIRLARFNIEEGENGFLGLATPGAGIFFAGITLFVAGEPALELTVLILRALPLEICIVVISLLMIIPLPMFSLKFSGLGWKENGFRYAFLAISGILLIILQEIALPVIIIVYLLASIILNITGKLSK